MNEKKREYGKNMRVSLDELARYQMCIEYGVFEPHESLGMANIAVFLAQEAMKKQWSRAEMAEYELRYETERADKAEAELRAIRRILDGVPPSDGQQCGRR